MHSLKYRKHAFLQMLHVPASYIRAVPSLFKLFFFFLLFLEHNHRAITLCLLYSGRKPLDRVGLNTAYFTVNGYFDISVD